MKLQRMADLDLIGDFRIKYSGILTPLWIIAITLIGSMEEVCASDYDVNHNPQSYVLTKLKFHDIVLLGTRHRQPPILEFISKIIPELRNSGVTHIGLEVESDQQEKIDQFMKIGTGLSAIKIHTQIDCPEYRNLFNLLRDLDPAKRPNPIALDLPESKYSGKISRNEWMAKSIAGLFESNPNAKILVVVGNNHVFKKLDWQNHVVNQHRSIREYLSVKRSNLRIFSIGQIIGDSVYECDFRGRFSGYEGAVAVDIDERFVGWKMGIVQSMAIKPAEVWELLDGIVVY